MTTPIIPKADEVRVMSRETRFMSPVVVTDPRTGKPIAVMKEDPEGRYVHWCDAYAQCSAPSPAVGGEAIEVTADMVRAASESQARDDEGEFPPLCDLIGFSGGNKTRTVVRAALVAALEAFVRGRGKP